MARPGITARKFHGAEIDHTSSRSKFISELAHASVKTPYGVCAALPTATGPMGLRRTHHQSQARQVRKVCHHWLEIDEAAPVW